MRIFLSYRRSDSRTITGRLWQQLCAEFGRDNVFFDHDSLPPGIDFPSQIASAIEQSAAVLVMIGPTWVSAAADGVQRLSQPGDHVRREVELALERVGVVIPVLVDGAGFPTAAELPESMHPLLNRTARTLRDDPDFLTDAQRLVEGLRRAVAVQTGSSLPGGPGERLRDAVVAGRAGEATRLAFALLADAPVAIDDAEAAVEWLLLGRRWVELDQLVQTLPVAGAEESVVAHRVALLSLRVRTACGTEDLALAERTAAELARSMGAASPQAVRARSELAVQQWWADDNDAAAHLVRELADDLPHAFAGEPVASVWERVWLLVSLGTASEPVLRPAVELLASGTLADADALLGADHPLRAVAAAYQGMVTGVDPDAERLASGIVRSVGRSDPAYAWVWAAERRRLVDAGDLAGAAAARARTLAWTEAVLGAEHPETLSMLVWLCDEQQDAGLYAEAVRTGETLVTRRRLLDGRAAPETLEATRMLCWALNGSGRPDEAFTRLSAALAETSAATDSNEWLNAELGAVRFADAAGHSAEALALAETMLARPSGHYLDWAVALAHRIARDRLAALDRLPEAIEHGRRLASGGAVNDADRAADTLRLAELLLAAERYPETFTLLSDHEALIGTSLEPVTRLRAVLLRELVRDPATPAPLRVVTGALEELAVVGAGAFDADHRLNPVLVRWALAAVNERGDGSELTTDALSAVVDWLLAHQPDDWQLAFRFTEYLVRGENLPHLHRLLTALPAAPVPWDASSLDATLALARSALEYRSAGLPYRTHGFTVQPSEAPPPLRRTAPDRELREAHEQSEEGKLPLGDEATRLVPELERVLAYTSMEAPNRFQPAALRLAEVLWRDAERNGVPVPGPVGWFRSCWDFPLPTDRRGRVQVASAVIGYSLALLRDLPGRVQVGDTLFGGPSFGAALLAATVMRLNAGSSPVRLLGHGDWLQYLPLLVPVRTRTRLRELDEGFGDLALRGEDGWIGEEVPDLFENAPIQGRSWQRLTQTVVGAWAERRFAERLDPYGRYSDGSWPVPPPDQALPEAYRQFAALLENHAREGRLFGDADG